MKNIIVIFVLFVSGISLFGQAHQFRGNNRDGQYPDKNLLDQWPDEGPEVVLKIENIGDGYAAPAVTEKAIYIAGEKDSIGSLYAFTHKGEMLWKYVYGKEFMYKFQGSRATPTVEKNVLYFFGSMGDAFCLNLKNGKPVWHVNLVEEYGAELIRWGNTESPLVVDDKVIFTPGGAEHNMIALHKKTGKLIWTTKAMGDPSSYCSPILINQGGKRVIVTQTSAYVIGVDLETGDLLWSVENNSPRGVNANAPLVKDGWLFNSIGYKYGSDMFRLKDDFSTPDTIWTTDEMDNKMDGPVLVDGYIYGCGDRNKKWFCFNWETGEKMWESKELSIGATIVADNKIFIHNYDGAVSMLRPNPQKFELLSTFGGIQGEKLLFSHPVIFDNKLFIRDKDFLTVYNISK